MGQKDLGTSQKGTGQFCLIAPLGGRPVVCRDLEAASAKAHAAGQLLLADLADSPGACPAIRLGADASMEPLGDGRVLLRVAVDVLRGEGQGAALLRGVLAVGEEPDAQTEGLLAKQNQEWRQASDAAQVVASYLRCHPRVDEVRYPGLRGDPSFDLAARTLEGGFGTRVSFRLVGTDAPVRAAAECGADAPGEMDAPSAIPWQDLACTAGDPMAQVLFLEEKLAKF